MADPKPWEYMPEDTYRKVESVRFRRWSERRQEPKNPWDLPDDPTDDPRLPPVGPKAAEAFGQRADRQIAQWQHYVAAGNGSAPDAGPAGRGTVATTAPAPSTPPLEPEPPTEPYSGDFFGPGPQPAQAESPDFYGAEVPGWQQAVARGASGLVSGDTVKALKAGAGDLLTTGARGLEYAGREAGRLRELAKTPVGQALSRTPTAPAFLGAAEGASRVLTPENLAPMAERGRALRAENVVEGSTKETIPEQLTDPRFYEVDVPRGAVSMVPSVVLGAIAALATGGAGAIAIGAGALSGRVLEALQEAGGVLEQAEQKGMGAEEADEAARKVFLANLPLAAVDALQLRLLLKPAGALFRAATKAPGVRRAAGVAASAVTEGAEEGYQEAVARVALDEPVAFDAEMQKSIALGGVLGGGMQTGAAAVDVGRETAGKVREAYEQEGAAGVARMVPRVGMTVEDVSGGQPTEPTAAKSEPAPPPASEPSAERQPWEMTRSEYRRAENGQIVAAIHNAFTQGKSVALATYTRATRLSKPEHIRVDDRGDVRIPQGKQWVWLLDNQVNKLARQVGYPVKEKGHYAYVAEAIEQGEPVAANVLAEYPELTEQPAEIAEEPTEAEFAAEAVPEPVAQPSASSSSRQSVQETDEEKLRRLEAKRHKSAGDELSIEVAKRRIAADPAKWQVGRGVGRRIGLAGRKGSQVNRGFRIIEIDVLTKEALIRQVADTGLTESGGDTDRLSDEWVHIADLVADRKYDASSLERQSSGRSESDSFAPFRRDVGRAKDETLQRWYADYVERGLTDRVAILRTELERRGLPTAPTVLSAAALSRQPTGAKTALQRIDQEAAAIDRGTQALKEQSLRGHRVVEPLTDGMRKAFQRGDMYALTKAQYLELLREEESAPRSADTVSWYTQTHRQYVEKALSENKPVPAAVLAEYPDLAEQYGSGARPPEPSSPPTEPAAVVASSQQPQPVSEPAPSPAAAAVAPPAAAVPASEVGQETERKASPSLSEPAPAAAASPPAAAATASEAGRVRPVASPRTAAGTMRSSAPAAAVSPPAASVTSGEESTVRPAESLPAGTVEAGASTVAAPNTANDFDRRLLAAIDRLREEPKYAHKAPGTLTQRATRQVIADILAGYLTLEAARADASALTTNGDTRTLPDETTIDGPTIRMALDWVDADPSLLPAQFRAAETAPASTSAAAPGQAANAAPPPPAPPQNPNTAAAAQPLPPNAGRILRQLTTNDDIEAGITRPGLQRTLGQSAAGQTGVGKAVIGAVDPFLVAREREEFVALVFRALEDQAANIKRQAMHILAAYHPKALKIKDGRITAGVKPRNLSQSMAWVDVFEHIGDYDADPSVVRFVKMENRLADEFLVDAKATGVKIHEKDFGTGHHYGRLVLAVREAVKRVQARPDQPRSYDSMDAGIQKGVNYSDDILATAEAKYGFYLRKMIGKRMGAYAAELGRKPSELIDPALDKERARTTVNLRNLREFARVVRSVRDGMSPYYEVPTPGYKAGEQLRRQLQMVEPAHPKLVQWVIQAHKQTGEPRVRTFQGVLGEADTLIARASMEQTRAVKARATAIERLQSSEPHIEGTPFGRPGETMNLGRVKMSWASGRLFPAETAEAINQEFGDKAPQALRVLENINSTVRSLKTGFDLGTMFLNLQPALFSHPRNWGKGVRMLGQALANPQVYEAYMAEPETSDVLRRLPYLTIEASEYTAGLERGGGLELVAGGIEKGIGAIGGKGAGRVATNIGYGFLYRASLAFTAPLNVVKIEMAKSLLPTFERAGQTRELALFLNNMTGTRSSLAQGIGETQRQVESTLLFFSPRFLRSSFALVGDALNGNMAGAEARKALAGMALGNVLILMALRGLLGQPIDDDFFDPSGGDFLTVELFGAKHSFPGPFRAMVALIGRSVRAAQEDPQAFLRPLDRRENPLTRWWTSRTAPLTGFVWNAIEGRDFMGEPLVTLGEIGEEVVETMAPMWFDDYLFQKPGEERSAAGIAPSLLGLSVVPVSAAEKRNDLRDQLAQERFGRPWTAPEGQPASGLSRPERYEVEQASTELQRATTLAEQIGERRGQLSNRFWATVEQKRAPLQQQIAELGKQLAKGPPDGISGNEYRERLSDIEREMALIPRTLKGAPEFKDVPLSNEERKAAYGPRYQESEHPDDVFIDAWYEATQEAIDPKTGIVDLDKLFALRDALQSVTDPAVVERAMEYINRNRDPRYVQAQQLMREYMRIPRWLGVDTARANELAKAERQLRATMASLPPLAPNKTQIALGQLARTQGTEIAQLAREATRRPKNPARQRFRFEHRELLDRFYSDLLRAESVPSEAPATLVPPALAAGSR